MAARSCRPFLATGAGAMVLYGCVMGPTYHVPDKALVNSAGAKGAFVEARDLALTGAPLPPHWWRLYDDRKLDGLVAEALASNTDLRKATANLERSRAALHEAQALRQPGAAVQAGVQHAQLAGEQYLQPITPPRNTYYDTALTVSYDLDLFGGIRRGIEAAKASDEAVEAARDLVQVNVVAETARAYADACGAGLELAAANRSLVLQQQSLELTERLRRGGRAMDLDVTRSRQLVDQLTGAIPPLVGARRNALYRLATLTGRLPSQFDSELERCEAPPRIVQPLPIEDGAALLKRRPDIREAERYLASATAEIGVATAQLYPDIQLAVPLGSVGVTRDAFTSPTNYFGVGAVLSWQANRSAARARIAQAEASTRLALANFDGVVLTALRDVETALNSYTHDLKREASTRTARDDAATVVQEAQRLQLDGRATSLDVIDAQRTLAYAEQTLAQLESAISDDQVAVFLALGGGWDVAEDHAEVAQAGASGRR
jgi:NodT family efflux transporter outer membrane factor (OMF) lipoprotein